MAKPRIANTPVGSYIARAICLGGEAFLPFDAGKVTSAVFERVIGLSVSYNFQSRLVANSLLGDRLGPHRSFDPGNFKL